MNRLLLVTVLALALPVAAGVDPDPKLYYTDVTSAPAGSYVCGFGRNFGVEGSASVWLNAAQSPAGCEVSTFVYYDQTGHARGTADSAACIEMPTSGACATVDSFIYHDGTTDSNTLALARHSGTVYWVRDDGDDGNTCLGDTAGTACGTPEGPLSKGGWGVGGVIVMHSGTWSGTGVQFDTDSAGSSTQPKTLRGYPGELPKLLRTDDPSLDGQFIVSTDDYWQFVGFEVTCSANSTATVEGVTIFKSASDMRIADVYMSDTSETCVQSRGGDSRLAALGNEMNSCGDIGPVDWHGHGFYFAESSDNTVAFNSIHDGAAIGVNLYRSGSGNLSTGHRVYSNEIYSNSLNDNRGGGVLAGCKSDNVDIFNNVIRDNGVYGIKIECSSHNARVFNNTLYNNYVEIKLRNTPTGAIIVNNVLYHTVAGSSVDDGAGGSQVWSHNLYHGTAAFGDDSNPTTENPDFVTPGSDFHIEEGGGAIDCGTTPPSARATDYELNDAPVDYHDCGAYEFQTFAEPPDPPDPEAPPGMVQGVRFVGVRIQ